MYSNSDIMLRFLLIFSTISFVFALPRNVQLKASRNTAEVISYLGYQAESHKVITEDGYILEMQRIPYKRGETSGSPSRPVVFLMHGLLTASFAFVGLGPEFAIAYNLADAGFDVWLGNARGNKNSRAHVTLDPDADQLQFFDYSWEDVAIYDVAAMVDYILDLTGKKKLHYIGHSQGGTVFLVLNSMRVEYNDKFASAHLLAPAGYQNNFPDSQLALTAAMVDIIYSMAVASGNIEVDPPNDDATNSTSYNKYNNCFGDIKYKPMCELIGVRKYLREDYVPELANMGGGSLKQVAHFGQNIRDKQFRRWNYGPTENEQVYGSTDPPTYDLGLITVNTILHYTLNDTLVGVMDILAMAEDMPNSEVRKVERDSFLHEDFAVAPDVKELVTEFMIETMLVVEETLYPESNENQDSETSQDNENESNQDNDSDETAPDPIPGSSSTVTYLSIVYKISLTVLSLKSVLTYSV